MVGCCVVGASAVWDKASRHAFGLGEGGPDSMPWVQEDNFDGVGGIWLCTLSFRVKDLPMLKIWHCVCFKQVLVKFCKAFFLFLIYIQFTITDLQSDIVTYSTSWSEENDLSIVGMSTCVWIWQDGTVPSWNLEPLKRGHNTSNLSTKPRALFEAKNVHCLILLMHFLTSKERPPSQQRPYGLYLRVVVLWRL